MRSIMKIFFILILPVLIFAQTGSTFIFTLESKATGLRQPGRNVDLYQNGQKVYDLTEVAPGIYKGTNIQTGIYDIYVNGNSLNEYSGIFIGGKKLVKIDGKFNDDGHLIVSSAIEDSAITKNKLSRDINLLLSKPGSGSAYPPDDNWLQFNIAADTTLTLKTSTLRKYFVAADTNELKTLNFNDGEFVYLKQLSATNKAGNGLFVVADSAYPEGGIAFDHPTPGKQLVRVDFLDKKIVNVKWFGAVGDGIVDDAQSIQKAIDAATKFNESLYSSVIGSKARVFAQGTFKITTTIKVTCDIDMRNAIFVVPSTFASTALKIEAADGSSYLQLNDTYLPTVKVESQVDNWTYASTGIQITSVIDSKIHFGEVWYFKTGIVITTWAGKGCSYNDFYLNSIRNNKTGLLIYPASSGWTNENNFYGGRIRIDSGYSNYTGTVLLHLTGNNNIFYKLTVEGDYDEIKIWLDATTYGYTCSYNTFYNLRPEKTGGNWKLLVDGANCLRNVIFLGYIANFSEINYTTQNGATSEAIYFNIPREEIKIGTSSSGVVKLQNKTSNNYPIISLYPLQIDPKTYPDSTTGRILPTGFWFKSYYTYKNPYVYADPNVQGLRIGSANLNKSNAPYFKTQWLDASWQLSIIDAPFRVMDGLRVGNNNTALIDSAKVVGDTLKFYVGGVPFNAVKGY